MKQKLTLSVLFLALIMLYSCSDQVETIEPVLAETELKPIVLGESNGIPFSVENMKKALEQHKTNPTTTKIYENQMHRQQSTRSADPFNINIETTHYYYKFTPTDSSDIEILLTDTILNVVDIPFEYDIETNGESYQDPDFEGTDLTYYYSVAPVDYQVPSGLNYEIIENLYFTKEDEITSDNPTPQEEQLLRYYEELSTIALLNAGYLDQEDLDALQFITPQQETISHNELVNRGLNYSDVSIDFTAFFWFFGRKWNPYGRVTVEEDALVNINGGANSIVGVRGAEIRVRKWGWLVVSRGFTREDGSFRCSSTRTKYVKYACYFNNKEKGFLGIRYRNFTIMDGSVFWSAKHRGHRRFKRAPWYQHFPQSIGKSQFFGLVQNGAYDYYHYWTKGRPFDLTTPRRLRISAKYWGDGSNHTWFDGLLWSEIRVSRRSGKTYRGSDGIYATTTHELTHASHYAMDSGMFFNFRGSRNEREVLRESWAEGVETIITNHRYQQLEPAYFRPVNRDIGWNFSRQLRIPLNTSVYGYPPMNEYTPLFIDLNDNLNQSSHFHSSLPLDRLSGYSVDQMEDALDDCRFLEDLEDNLRNDFNNPTEGFLNDVFDYAQTVADNL